MFVPIGWACSLISSFKDVAVTLTLVPITFLPHVHYNKKIHIWDYDGQKWRIRSVMKTNAGMDSIGQYSHVIVIDSITLCYFFIHPTLQHHFLAMGLEGQTLIGPGSKKKTNPGVDKRAMSSHYRGQYNRTAWDKGEGKTKSGKRRDIGSCEYKHVCTGPWGNWGAFHFVQVHAKGKVILPISSLFRSLSV